MNSLTELIIFAAIMAIVSLFGKKKKKKPQDGRTPGASSQGNIPRRTGSTQRNTSTQEMLEEILGFKLPQQEQPAPRQEGQTKSPARRDTVILDPPEQDQTTWDPAEEYKDALEVKTVRYENNKEQKPSYKRSVERTKRTVERAQKVAANIPDVKIEHLNAELERKKRIAGKIKRTIHNPESLKDYIIISEILSKPKALRR